MDIVPTGFIPGDPRLIEQIVYELKSQGIFDQFRKECIADVDTKPAYQNLRQRVEGSVNNFLNKQTFSGDMNKNQIREQLRKNISESGFLEIGVERIVDQVVNPKINTVFLPKVEDVVYRYLGVERPSHDIKKELKVEGTDLLPEDLEAVSPESVHEQTFSVNIDQKEIGTEVYNTSFNSLNTKTEDESPAFEPLEENTKISLQEENDQSSALGPAVGHDGESKYFSYNLETFQDISQSSKNSHDLSIEMSEENSKMEICEEDVSSDKHEVDDKSTENINEIKIDTNFDDNEKKVEDKRDNEIKSTDDKKSNDSKKAYDRHKSRSDRKDDKDKRNRSKSESKSKDHKDYKSSSRHSSSKDRDKEKKDYRNGKDKIDGSDKNKLEKNKDGDKVKEGDKNKDKSYKTKDGEREKDKSQKEKERNDKSKSDKDRSRSSTSSNSNKYNKDSSSNSKSSGKDKDRSGDRSQDKESAKNKEGSSKDKDISKSSKDKDKSKSSSSSSSKDKDKRHYSSSRSSDKHKKSSDKDKPSDKKSSNTRKDKKSVDDHYSSKDKKSDRRSTDRDSNDGSSKTSRQSSFIDTLGSKASSKESSEVFSSGSGDSNNSDKTDAATNDTDSDSSAKDNSVEIQTIKYNKPKLACNIHEVMKIMKIRKQLARLERKNQLSLTDIQFRNAGAGASDLNNVAQKNDDQLIKESQNPESPGLKTKQLSMESFEALEAKLAEEMSTVDCSTYGEEDDNFEYTSVLFSPIKKRNSLDAINIIKGISSNAFERQPSVDHDIKEEVEIVVSSHNNNVPDMRRQEQVEGQDIIASISDCSNEDNEKENKLQNNKSALFKINTAKTGKKCFLNLQGDANIADSNRSKDQEFNEQNILTNELSHRINNSQNPMLMSAEDNGPCYYFERDNSRHVDKLELLHNTIKKLESAIQRSSLKVKNTPIHKTRNRKRKIDNGETNNKPSDLHTPLDHKRRHTSEAKLEPGKECLYNSDVPHNQNFNLPLSPAESDKSGEHKKEEPLTVKTKRTGRVSVGRGNERYSNEDLYKPRPVFNYTSSRRRAKTEQF